MSTLHTRTRFTSKTIAVDSKAASKPLTEAAFAVERLPGARFANPLTNRGDRAKALNDNEQFIMYDPHVLGMDSSRKHAVSLSPFKMKIAQVARHIHFDPSKSVVGIVTCGGLCPGLNDVVRGVTYMSLLTYGVKRVIGFRNGFWGLSAAGRDTHMELDTTVVQTIHRRGGTFLGSSRGPQPATEMVDTLVQLGVNILFTVGGDGTQKGASKIAEEAKRRGLDIAVVGIPKTIDNDLSFSHRTFGFETAVEHAVTALRAAHAEASSAPWGIGVVKVMGRDSGFIAAHATIASQQVNVCLVPECVVSKETFFKLVESRFALAEHCVICVAEGFGQDWFPPGDLGTDVSGNKKLQDIGALIRDMLTGWMKKHPKFKAGTVKLIDPSYMIRATPPNTSDAAFCVNLATLAVHEAMRGTTNAIIANWYNNFIVVPISLATSLRKVVSTDGELWRQVREVTVHCISDCSDSVRKDQVDRRIRILESELETCRRQRSKL